MKTNKRSLSGQSLIEFAVVLPLLFILLMGLFDIGRAVFFYAVLNNAVREGTRTAVVQPDCDYKTNPGSCSGNYVDSYPLDCNNASSSANIKICNEIRDNYFILQDLLSSTITIRQIFLSNEDPKIVIEIEYLFEPITPGLGLIASFPMRVSSQMLMAPIAQP